jgi:hypothetical protein
VIKAALLMSHLCKSEGDEPHMQNKARGNRKAPPLP